MNLKHPNKKTTAKSIPKGKVVAGTTSKLPKKMGNVRASKPTQRGASFNGRAYEKVRKSVFGLPKAEDQGKA